MLGALQDHEAVPLAMAVGPVGPVGPVKPVGPVDVVPIALFSAGLTASFPLHTGRTVG